MTNRADFKRAQAKTAWLPVGSLSVIWPTAQREYRKEHVKFLVDNFDPDVFGVVTVCKPNGQDHYHIIDGQHRVCAVQDMWGDNEQVPCQIVECTSPSEAAQAFAQLNRDRRVVPALDLFKVSVTAGSEPDVTIEKVVRRMGFKVGRGAHGSIAAVKALRMIYTKHGKDGLADVLQIIKAAWGYDQNATQHAILLGLGDFIAEYGNQIAYKAFCEKLSKRYTPGRLLGAARVAKDVTGGNTADAMKFVLVSLYNHGRAQGKLVPPVA